MTCREVMTAEPVCCLPGDPVHRAARLMRDHDVGPVPVVNNQHEKRLLGIVTDRDLTVNVLAAGRDANTTRVEEVMTRNPVYCRAEDSFERCVSRMESGQIRRMPIVDDDGLLVGIISQADVARHAGAGEVGEMVEEISEPSSMLGHLAPTFRFSRESRRSGAHAAGAIVAGMSAACLGAAAMYLLDPAYGRRRRAFVRDKAVGAYNAAAVASSRTGRDLRNRATGLVAEARQALRPDEEVDDKTLVARIRTRLGRLISHPSSVHVSAMNGRVTLEGSIPSHECECLLDEISSMAGVHGVDNRLRTYDDGPAADSAASFGSHLLSSSWTPGARAIAGTLGGAMAAYGFSRRSPLANAAGAVGLVLFARGVAGLDLTDAAALRDALHLDELRGVLPSRRAEQPLGV